MKRFKKIMSAVIASATLLAGTAFPVSADYSPYDVNRDGYVGAADIPPIIRYLAGVYSAKNYNQLDVNRNLIVDEADKECLTQIVLKNTYDGAYYSRKTGNVLPQPTVSGFTPSESSSSTASRTYMRCRYDNNGNPTALSDYTLTPIDMGLNDGTSPRYIIGTDDRYTSSAPENSGIVYLTGNATGFIVGDHQIATAAHCVYYKSENYWYPMKIKTYDSNGCLTDNYLHPVEVHIPKSYDSSVDDMYDYALITVSDDLSDYVHFSLGTPYNVSASAYSNIPIYVTGCPGYLFYDPNNPKRNDTHHLYSAEGRIMNKILNSYTDVIYYDVDTSTGNSGSPVYTITKIGSKYVYTAIAIHHGGDKNVPNVGSMITNYHLQFYNNNPNASYSAN